MVDPVPVLEDLPPLKGKKVLVRCDFNVPLDKEGNITDDLRIRSALPTLQWLVDQGAEVVACSHLGRPKGEPNPKYSMKPVQDYMAKALPQVSVMENLRYDPGEEKNSPEFVAKLTEGIDYYVDDAFGAAHRKHASIVGPPSKGIPSVAGRLLQKEVEVLGGMLNEPKKPFVAIMGGAKVSDKLAVIDALLAKCDQLVVGGGMCFTFLKAKGQSIGSSLCEDDQVATCKKLLEGGAPIVLPTDIVVMSSEGKIGEPGAGGEVKTVSSGIEDGWMGLDIGPESIKMFEKVIGEAGMIFWNGPMGVFEDPRFASGTKAVADAVANGAGFSVVGGGDSAAAAKKFGLDAKMNWVSTGGGASLELLENGDLPGLIALRDAAKEWKK